MFSGYNSLPIGSKHKENKNVNSDTKRVLKIPQANITILEHKNCTREC